MSRSLFTSQRALEVLGIVLVWLCFTGAMMYQEKQTVRPKLKLSMQTKQREVIQVYWRKDGGYSNEQLIVFTMSPSRTHYEVPLPAFVDFEYLRIDPGNHAESEVTFLSATLESEVTDPIDLFSLIQNGEIRRMDQIVLEKNNSVPSIIMRSQGVDPQFELKIPSITIHYRLSYYFFFLFGLLTLFAFFFSQERLKGKQSEATVSVIVDKDVLFKVSDLPTNFEKRIKTTFCQSGKNDNVYTIFFNNLLPSEHLELMETMKLHYPNAKIHIQYNRSGEV